MDSAEMTQPDLWARSGEQCAICYNDVQPGSYARPDVRKGVEYRFENDDGSILLCLADAAYVIENPDAFTSTRLRKLRAAIEVIRCRRLELLTTGVTESVRVLCHIARFVGNVDPIVFIKIVNDSLLSPAVVEAVWFETNPPVTVQNPQRPLPTLVSPGQQVETWMALSDIPLVSSMLELARVKLETGTIIKSEVNVEVPPGGELSGGGTPLAELQVNRDLAQSDRDDIWDVFISHASADKDAVARPLRDALERHGLKVWFDEAVLRIGDSLRRNIDKGLRQSAAGVIILSPSFFEREWPNYELDGIVTLNQAGLQNILPIWHQVTAEQVRNYSPSLADKVARSTSSTSIEAIAAEIAERIQREDRAAD